MGKFRLIILFEARIDLTMKFHFSKSIIDMTTHALLLTSMVTLGLLINNMNTMEPAILKSKPWYPYTIHLIGPCFIVTGTTILLYARNNGLRSAVFREALERIPSLSRNLRSLQ